MVFCVEPLWCLLCDVVVMIYIYIYIYAYVYMHNMNICRRCHHCSQSAPCICSNGTVIVTFIDLRDRATLFIHSFIHSFIQVHSATRQTVYALSLILISLSLRYFVSIWAQPQNKIFFLSTTVYCTVYCCCSIHSICLPVSSVWLMMCCCQLGIRPHRIFSPTCVWPATGHTGPNTYIHITYCAVKNDLFNRQSEAFRFFSIIKREDLSSPGTSKSSSSISY